MSNRKEGISNEGEVAGAATAAAAAEEKEEEEKKEEALKRTHLKIFCICSAVICSGRFPAENDFLKGCLPIHQQQSAAPEMRRTRGRRGRKKKRPTSAIINKNQLKANGQNARKLHTDTHSVPSLLFIYLV